MRRLTCLLLALGLAVLTVGPAAADDATDGPERTDALELSLDGTHWSSSPITTPLFDPKLRWVPGDVRTATFYVRNTMPDAGALKVSVERSAREALLDTGWLQLSARAGDGRWTSIESGGRHVLVDDDRLAGTSAVPVHVRAAFDFAAPNGTMVLASDLDFEVVLADATAVLGAGGTAGGGNGGTGVDVGGNGEGDGTDGGGNAAGPGTTVDDPLSALPGTGSEIRPWLTPFALVLLAAGAVLIARRDRREEAGRG